MSFIYNMADTWNAIGTTFNAILMNVSNGAGGAPVFATGSAFINIQSNGTPVFQVDPSGSVFIPNNQTYNVGATIGGNQSGVSGAGTNIYAVSNSTVLVNFSNGQGTQFRGGQPIGFSPASPDAAVSDTRMHRDALGVFGMRDGATPHTLNIYNTFTDASNYERTAHLWTSNYAFLQNEIAGTGVKRPLIYNSGSFTVATLTASLPSPASAGAGARLYVSNPSGIVFGTTVTGSGGGTASPIYSDGTNWRIG